MPIAESAAQRQRLTLILLFLAAVMVLSLGIGEVTGITGKDEYFLSLRTPLTMMEQDRWLIPWLDEAPRLKKPPLLYWLARASFELFGPSLASARLLSVLFGAGLVVLTVLIGRRLSRDEGYSLSAGLIVLSTLALAVEGRRLMLDLPCATLSALALYLFLRWRDRPSWWTATASAAAFAAGFLTKGPLVAILFGSAVLAMVALQADMRAHLWRHKLQVAGFVAVFLVLALPWFVYVYQQFPAVSVSMLEEDAEARELLSFSAAPIAALILVPFPWSFMLLSMLARAKRLRARLGEAAPLFILLVAWLLVSIVPFFFFKSFARYMAGSLVPMALLIALLPRWSGPYAVRWAARAGLTLAAVLVLGFTAFAAWFDAPVWVVLLTLAAFGYFAGQWWRSRALRPMAASAAILWMVFLGLLYPTLGINAIPARIPALVGERAVILYKGPQPALLSMVMGRAYLRTKDLDAGHLRARPLIFVPQRDAATLRADLAHLGAHYTQVDSFQTLSSRTTWLNFARKDATRADWRRAFRTRSLDPVKSTVLVFAPREGEGD